jgi:deazaflavin-dependent oxidoreductase (nitroreductase family)
VRWQKLYNPMVSWLLRSPLHGLISSSTMLISYTGRESGKAYTTPVNYVWDGDTLLVVSPRDRIWWKNLQVESPVTVRVAGRDLRGVGRAFEGEDAEKEGGLLTVLRKAPLRSPVEPTPAFRRYRRVELDPAGQPEDRQDLLRVARANALIRIGDLVPA